ncbi:VanZ family protein [Tenacibaculum soleae]|uniref:VanZ family protein n=1 Tax=Tenacibaculum soleae TaxID=447689 RepID=UPI003AB1F434
MLKHIKNLLSHNLIRIAILITIGIAFFSLIKIENQQIQIKNIDKLKHLIAYFILTFIWLLAFKKTKTSKLFIAFCCFFFGIIIEALQVTITTHRSGELLDIVANTMGILIAYIIYFLFFKKNVAI